MVAPASAFPGVKNWYYKNEEEMLFAIADALHEEYKLSSMQAVCADR